MPSRTESHTGQSEDAYADGYPWSWPKPVPAGSEIHCLFTRDALRIAEALASRRFAGHPDRDERICDAVSCAWELTQQETYRQHGHPGSVAAFAVNRVAVARHFHESQTSIDHRCPQDREPTRRCSFFERVTGDKEAPSPRDAAIFRIDLLAWLGTLTSRQREVAILFATGHTTSEIADRSGCTTNAIRMIRMALRRRYEAFTGAPATV
jgi:hypothetical protein